MGKQWMTKEKQMAAALAAVAAYMQQEEESFQEQLAAAMTAAAQTPAGRAEPVGPERAPEHDADAQPDAIESFRSFQIAYIFNAYWRRSIR
jgi:hypothetical protein